MNLIKRLLGKAEIPEGFAGELGAEEHVVAVGVLTDGGHLVVTNRGIWVPPARRIGWHLVSKATWGDGALSVVEAEEEQLDGAVLLTDLPPRRYRLREPGAVPEAVHRRVTESIRSRHHRDLDTGGAWFLQRKVPGRDGTVLQVRPDPGADVDAVRTLAQNVARKLTP
ncbi:MAG: hypothetical protein OJJ54_23895 [Pseudonocardia sp.]|nr:hypothetical protein [Pseudonocardia sp.]